MTVDEATTEPDSPLRQFAGLIIATSLALLSTLVVSVVENFTDPQALVVIFLCFSAVYLLAWALPVAAFVVVALVAIFAGGGWAIAAVPIALLLASRSRGARRNFTLSEVLRIVGVTIAAFLLATLLASLSFIPSGGANDETSSGSSEQRSGQQDGGAGSNQGSGSGSGSSGSGSGGGSAGGSGFGDGSANGSGDGTTGSGNAGNTGNVGSAGNGGSVGNGDGGGATGDRNGGQSGGNGSTGPTTDGQNGIQRTPNTDTSSGIDWLLVAIVVLVVLLLLLMLIYLLRRDDSSVGGRALSNDARMEAALQRLEAIGNSVGRPRHKHEGALGYADALFDLTGDDRLRAVGPLLSAHMFDRSSASDAERLSALEDTLSEIEANPPLVPA